MTLTMPHGRVCMSWEEIDLLARVVGDAVGDHCEIGSMWGGTAIVAASAKEHAGRGERVVCIDPFSDSDAEGGKPDEAIFWGNIDDAGFHDSVELHVCQSAPWPLPMTRRFGSVLIDGNHNAPWPETDWESARCVTNVILVHDVNWHEPAVARLHARVMHEGEWRLLGEAKFLYAYEKIL